jgi:YwiC-like protein
MTTPSLAFPTAGAERRRALVFPREHGAWGILLVPLATGATVALMHAGHFWPLLPLTVAAVALFWARTPLETLLGTGPVRARSGRERRMAVLFLLALAALAALSLAALFRSGNHYQLLWLGAVAAGAFALQALVRKFHRKARMIGQLIGAAGLTATAPAAYYVAAGRFDAVALILWLANWVFAGNQIHFVQLRIHTAKSRSQEGFGGGRAFLAGHIVAGSVLVSLCYLGLLSWFVLIAFAPVFARGLVWLLQRPTALAVRRLGWTELAHAIAFGLLLVLGFRLAA